MGAALAYYTAFTIAPLVVVAVSIAGLVVGDQAAEGEIVAQLEDAVGPETAAFVEGLVERTSGGGAAGGATLGLLIGLVAASSLAVNLRRMLNAIWEVPQEQQSGLGAFLRARVAGLAAVAGTGLLVLVVLVASAALAAVGDLPGSSGAWARLLYEAANLAAGLVLGAVAFALLLKFLPAAVVAWRDAMIGGAVTSVLFTVGSWGFARYVGSGAVGRGFGAAAALVVLLVFVYYTAQIVLFGAECAAVSAGVTDGVVEDDQPSPESPEHPAEPAPPLWAFGLGVLVGGWARRRTR